MSKTIDTRKQCKGVTPQGRQCTFKITPGHLYCGVHKRSLDTINEKARTQSVNFLDQRSATDGSRWLPLRLNYVPEVNLWFLVALRLDHKMQYEQGWCLRDYTMHSCGVIPGDVIDTRDYDETSLSEGTKEAN